MNPKAIDCEALEAEITAEISKERAAKARDLLKRKLREKEAAEQVLAAVNAQLLDLKAQIAAGAF